MHWINNLRWKWSFTKQEPNELWTKRNQLVNSYLLIWWFNYVKVISSNGKWIVRYSWKSIPSHVCVCSAHDCSLMSIKSAAKRIIISFLFSSIWLWLKLYRENERKWKIRKEEQAEKNRYKCKHEWLGKSWTEEAGLQKVMLDFLFAWKWRAKSHLTLWKIPIMKIPLFTWIPVLPLIVCFGVRLLAGGGDLFFCTRCKQWLNIKWRRKKAERIHSAQR